MKENRFYRSQKAGTTGEMTLTGRGGIQSVIKDSYVEEEFLGYQKIQNHLRTLPTRRINFSGKDALIIKFCESDTVDQLTNLNDPKSLEGFKAFFDDLTSMWDKTRRPFDEKSLTRNYAKIAIEVMPKFQQFAVDRLGISLNGIIYIQSVPVGTLGDFFNFQKQGFEATPPHMVLSHGDENLTNLLVPKNPIDGVYKVIDARFAGYYDPAWVLGNIYGRTYLFNATFPAYVGKSPSANGVAVFENPLPSQTSTTQEIKNIVVEYITKHEAKDPTLALRTAAYIANNIGSSIAFLRDKSFTKICEDYGKQHLLTAMYEVHQK